MKKYHSQFGQDKYLYETYFKDKVEGYYVDIGAHDGETGSNSLFFENIGWQGVCFEPIPEVYEKLVSKRKCTTYQAAVSATNGTAEFFVLKGHSEALSGLVGEYHPNHIQRINQEIEQHPQEFEYLQVQTVKFDEVIDRHDIDILSVDTEGSEASILRSINFSLYKIKAITVEVNYGTEEIDSILIPEGFTPVQILGCDCVYVNRNLL